jgi:hypothetical protein
MIEQPKEVKIELIKKLTLQDINSMAVAQFDSMFMYLDANYKPIKWKTEFNSKMIELSKDKFTCTVVTPEEIEYNRAMVLRIIEKKIKEGHVIADPGYLVERWETGKKGEFAFSKYLGYNFLDYNAYKRSSSADVVDVLGLAGVKTSKIGNFPCVSLRKAKYPEIIMIEGEDGRYYNAGMHHASDLNTFTYDYFVFDKRMRTHKTAYYNYTRGLQFGPGLDNFYYAVSTLTGKPLAEVRAKGEAAIEKLEIKKLEEK